MHSHERLPVTISCFRTKIIIIILGPTSIQNDSHGVVDVRRSVWTAAQCTCNALRAFLRSAQLGSI